MNNSEHPCRRFPVPMAPMDGDHRVVEQYRQDVQKTLQRLAERPGRPAAMAPFDDLLGGTWRAEELAEGGRPVVGYVCTFVPDELVLAAGAVPLRLDLGHHLAAQAGGRVLSPDLCPEVLAVVGAQLCKLPYHDQLDLMVLPTACDGKKKLPRVLRTPSWILSLPQSRQGARSQQQWRREIEEFVARLRKLTGRSLSRRGLRRAIELVNRRTTLLRKLNKLRITRPGLLCGQDAFLVMQASFVADVSWWVEQAEALLLQLEQAPDPDPAAAAAPRILITGSPVLFPEFKLLQIIEEAGALIVADEMCSATQHLYNPTVLDEGSLGGMIRATADKTLLPCTCPCFTTGDTRIERILQRARESGASGVIHHTLRLCQLFDMELPAVTEALRQQELPLFNISTEYSAEDAAVIRTRVEAFLEMISGEV